MIVIDLIVNDSAMFPFLYFFFIFDRVIFNRIAMTLTYLW